MAAEISQLYPGDLALLLIPLCKPEPGHTHRKCVKGEWIDVVCDKPGKKPQAGNDWNAKATARYLSRVGHDQHLSMITGRHSDGANVGLTIPPTILALDADSPESVEWLERRLPNAPRQDTHDGAHFFCRAPAQFLKATVGVRVAGAEGVLVDLRTAGESQVVVEPSVHVEGTEYRWVRQLPEDLSILPECPQEVVDGYNQGAAEKKKVRASIDSPVSIFGPEFPEGTRNASLFARACWIRERSVTEGEFEAEVYATNEKLCKPPLDRSEVAGIIQSAANRIELLPFTFDTPPPLGSPGDRGAFRPGLVPFRPARSLDDIEGLAVDCWVKGLIPKDSTGFVYGPHSSGKTFWTMRLMAAVADGEPFLGRRTKQGLVFYLCGEGKAGIDRRTRALRLQGYLETDNLLVRSLIPNLLEDSPVTEAIALIRAEAEARGLPVALIVFDTLSRAMPGGDENPGKDTSKAFASADRIRQAFPGSTALIVAHTGKDDSRGLRGHSNQAANAEFLISIRREGNPQDRTSSWKVEKQKDGETTAPEMFELVLVDLGVTDEDGEPITSCVAEPAEGTIERFALDGSFTKREAGCWEVIQGLLGPAADGRTTTSEAVNEALQHKVPNDSTRRTWVQIGLPKLQQRGLIREEGGLIGYAHAVVLL